MKKKISNFFLILIFPFSFFSCNEEKAPFKDSIITCFDGIKNGDEKGIDCGGGCSDFCPIQNSLEGDIYLRTSLKSSVEYTITGPLIIRDGASLDIPAGMTLKVAPNRNAYIVITQGAKIYAYGTEENPIIITSASDNPQPGDWGGIIICGKAPINNGDLSRSEVGDIFYGGNEPNDSSGFIRHFTVEYTGATFRNVSTFSGISFFGVGSYTTVNNVQSLNSLGDGFKFYGGNVNATGLVTTNSSRNGLSIQDGWFGQIEKCYQSGIEETGISISENTSTDSANIREVSLIGNNTQQALNYGDGRGIVNFENIYTSNFSLGIKVDGDEAGLGIEANEFTVSTIQFDNPSINFMQTNYTGNNQSFYSEGTTTGAGNNASLPDWAINWVRGY
tara:strand:- start:12528 stop:13697 length:1170 start_codon:yes stop_codon:yes gene_type:complete